MTHSGEQTLRRITILWEWVKLEADRKGSLGILTRAKKDRDDQPAREEWSSKPWGGGRGLQVVASCILHGRDMYLLGWRLSLLT